jgi:hypothetical protein
MIEEFVPPFQIQLSQRTQGNDNNDSTVKSRERSGLLCHIMKFSIQVPYEVDSNGAGGDEGL